MDIGTWDFLVTPIVAALVGLAVWYFQSRMEALRREQERLRDERRQIYADVLEPFVRLFAGMKNPTEMQKALEKVQSVDYRRTAFEFSLVGADKVVNSFNELMQYIYSLETRNRDDDDTKKLLSLWGSFLLEIRRNVGDPKTALRPVDMLRNQIKDIDRVLS